MNDNREEATRRIDTANLRIWEAAHEDPDGSLAEGEELLMQSRELTYPRGQAEALRTMAYALSVLDDVEGGFDRAWEALDVLSQSKADEPDVEATLHDTLANLYFFVGMYAQSYEQSREGIQAARRAGATRVEAYCLRNLGIVYSAQRDLSQARTLFEQSKELFESIDYHIGVGWDLFHLGDLAFREGDTETALDYFHQVLASISEQEVGMLYAYARNGVARSLWQLSRLDEAIDWVDAAARAERQYDRIRTETELIRGRIYRAIGRGDEALDILEEAARLAADHSEPQLEAEAREVRGSIFADRDNFAEAYRDQLRAGEARRKLLNEDAQQQLRKTELRYSLEAVRKEEEQRRLEDLQRLNEELEERVRLRTRDLEEERTRLQELNEQLVRISGERQDLIRILSHDLRTPFSNIWELLQFMGNSENGEAGEFLSLIRDSTETGLEIIDSVRQMLAVESGKQHLDAEAIRLREAVDQAVRAVHQNFAEKGIRFERQIDEELVVIADRATLVNSVLANFLSNAAKFSPEGATVRVSAQSRDGLVLLSVEDRGIGIPEELLESIFDPFSPSSREGTRGESGTGFGMPLAKGLVERYGGSVSVSSSTEEGSSGTTVTCSLPAPQ